MRFSYLEQRCYWPRAALTELATVGAREYSKRAVLHQRLHQYNASEMQLLASFHQNSVSTLEYIDTLELLCGLRLYQGRYNEAEELLNRAKHSWTSNKIVDALHFRERQLALHTRRPLPQTQKDFQPDSNILWTLLFFQEAIQSQASDSISQMLKAWPDQLNTPEGLELRGLALKALGNTQAATEIFSDLLSQDSGSARAWVAAIELNYIAGNNNSLALATAARLHPREPGIATHRVLVELQQRKPGQARRSAFQERILYSLGRACPSRAQSDSNLIYSYDHTGRADLTPYVHRSLITRLSELPALHQNVTMQLASQASPLYGPKTESLVAGLAQDQPRPCQQANSKLRIGLVSSDLYYHPVGRFVQMLLTNDFGRNGEVHLVNTGQPALEKLRE